MSSNSKISNDTKKVDDKKVDESTKPVVNPSVDTKDENEENTGKVVGGQKTVAKPKNVVHTIRDVFGKDDNVNRVKNIADTDITDKWAFDAYPLQAVIDLGTPPKEIDYVRICSENEQEYTLDFSNDNTLNGYSRAQKGKLKRGLNDIKTPDDIVARYVRLDFPGNKAVDENKDQKADPLGIYYVQVGSGEIDKTKPLPEPSPIVPNPEPEGPKEPIKPTEGRIKDWGADISKGADKWKIIQMKAGQKLYKVTDENGVNIADLFTTPENAKTFVAWHQWKQGKEPAPPNPEPPGPVDPNPNPNPTPGGKGVTKDGVQLLLADGSKVEYNFKSNFRDDGKRFDFKIPNSDKGTEASGYFRFKQNPVDDEVSIKWSEMSHSGKNAVQCYDSGVSIKDGKARLRFENPHPNYSGALGSGKGVPLNDKFIGYKGTFVPAADGSVTVTLYQDTGDNEGDKPANQWKQIFQYKDTKYKRSGPHPEVTFRVDDPTMKKQANLEAKWLSVATLT